MTNSTDNRFLYDIDIEEVVDSESDILDINLTLYYRTYSIDEGEIEITGSGEESKEISLESLLLIHHKDDPVDV